MQRKARQQRALGYLAEMLGKELTFPESCQAPDNSYTFPSTKTLEVGATPSPPYFTNEETEA